ARHALGRPNQLVIGGARLAANNGNLLRLPTGCALDHFGDGEAFPEASLGVTAAELIRPGHATCQHRCAYSVGPIVNAMVPTPAIVPARASPGVTGPTPSGVPV